MLWITTNQLPVFYISGFHFSIATFVFPWSLYNTLDNTYSSFNTYLKQAPTIWPNWHVSIPLPFVASSEAASTHTERVFNVRLRCSAVYFSIWEKGNWQPLGCKDISHADLGAHSSSILALTRYHNPNQPCISYHTWIPSTSSNHGCIGMTMKVIQGICWVKFLIFCTHPPLLNWSTEYFRVTLQLCNQPELLPSSGWVLLSPWEWH